MKVPMQVIKDSMNSRRSKFLRQSDPALQSLAGEEEEDGGVVLEAPATTPVSETTKPAKAQFKGHLNGLYNGLTKIMTSTCKIDSGQLEVAR